MVRTFIRAGELSRELDIYLIFGFLEREGEDLFNSCVMIDPQGRVIAHYRKVTTVAEYGITPGRELKPFDTPLGRFGLLLCSDRITTDNCRTLSVQGAQVILVPMDGCGGPDNTEKMRWLARDTGCWIVIANTWSAVIVSPSGETHLEKYETECVSVQFLHPDAVPVGPENTRFAGRRIDLYAPLAETFEGKRYYDEEGRLTAFGENRRQEARQEALERERK
jgi:predicted amidohydrolase